jgi:hypothetical protein
MFMLVSRVRTLVLPIGVSCRPIPRPTLTAAGFGPGLLVSNSLYSLYWGVVILHVAHSSVTFHPKPNLTSSAIRRCSRHDGDTRRWCSVAWLNVEIILALSTSLVPSKLVSFRSASLVAADGRSRRTFPDRPSQSGVDSDDPSRPVLVTRENSASPILRTGLASSTSAADDA